MMIRKTVILTLVWILVACGPAVTPAPTPTPIPTRTTIPTPTITSTSTLTPRPTKTPKPTSTPTLTPLETITVMTYNIHVGAGADLAGPCTGNDPSADPNDGNCLPRVLDVIKAVNPDILGIEEANGWHANGEAIAHQVAKDLGMNYVLGVVSNGFNVALFTKFEIRKVYPCCLLGVASNGAMHAEVVTNSGRVLDIFIVHLKNEPEDITTIIQKMAPYLGQDTILMGDMNFLPYSAYAKMLLDAGWVFPPVMDYNIIDMIWTSPSLAPSTWPEPALPSQLTYGASDHNPWMVRIGLYPPETK